MKKLSQIATLPKVLVVLGIIIVAGIIVFGAVSTSAKNSTDSKSQNTSAKTISNDENDLSKTNQIDGTADTGTTDTSTGQTTSTKKQSTNNPTSTPVQSTQMSDADKATLARLEQERLQGQLKSCQLGKEALNSTHDYNLIAAQAKNSTNLSAIDSDWLGRGMGYSGGYTAAKDAENARYQAEVNSINAQYSSKLSTYNC